MNGLKKKMTKSLFLFWFSDWHDGGNGAAVPELGQTDERGHCVCHRPVQTSVPNCPVGQRPVMIGRRKAAYDTVDKVMKRLDLITNVMKAMNFIVIDIH